MEIEKINFFKIMLSFISSDICEEPELPLRDNMIDILEFYGCSSNSSKHTCLLTKVHRTVVTGHLLWNSIQTERVEFHLLQNKYSYPSEKHIGLDLNYNIAEYTSISDDGNSCPKGFYHYQSRCYKVKANSESVTWNEASNTCRGMGGYLLSINTANEMDYIKSMLAQDMTEYVTTGIWFIGLTVVQKVMLQLYLKSDKYTLLHTSSNFLSVASGGSN